LDRYNRRDACRYRRHHVGADGSLHLLTRTCLGLACARWLKATIHRWRCLHPGRRKSRSDAGNLEKGARGAAGELTSSSLHRHTVRRLNSCSRE
jgi:hypothetical protein